MSSRNRHNPGIRCMYCNERSGLYSFKIKGTLGCFVCDHCAETHAAYVEPLEERPALEPAKEGGNG